MYLHTRKAIYIYIRTSELKEEKKSEQIIHVIQIGIYKCIYLKILEMKKI